MIHTADRIQQGGLAASAWSHNGNEFPFVNGKIHIAQNVIVFKRSMNTGYAGVQNPLFFKENTHMLFGDAKASVDAILKAL